MSRALVEEVIRIARAAGEEVLDVYAHGCAADAKADGSPVTDADRRAQAIICARLSDIAPGVAIVAEESVNGSSSLKVGPGKLWLVDPLDGTKEFLDRNGEFTINIALIEAGAPVLGVVFAPALERLFAAAPGVGAAVEDAAGQRRLSARATPPDGATIVSSRSHGDPDALARFTAGRRVAASVTAGSSLKFCLIAAGEADLYPRFGRTMEWDTAAGDAVLRAAGGRVTDLRGHPLRYGKPGFENPHFVASGRGDGIG
ncbi:MAG: 3'(2'),5'-bisphosphate nucleotidase CysQ [Solirubrobacterales bacterium]|nr:3'(2'),5'-bisphosphate nucleotidase CysQ [Solirubrobacterales bacterium]